LHPLLFWLHPPSRINAAPGQETIGGNASSKWEPNATRRQAVSRAHYITARLGVGESSINAWTENASKEAANDVRQLADRMEQRVAAGKTTTPALAIML
jgi:hypothetical protein